MKRILFSIALFIGLASTALAATLSVQTVGFPGLNHTFASASTADNFTNDGKTFLLFNNVNASARTLTIAANATTRPGFGSIATPSTVVTLPGSGTNGGLAVVGPFPTERFNDITTGKVNYTIDVITGLTVAAIKLTTYQ